MVNRRNVTGGSANQQFAPALDSKQKGKGGNGRVRR